MAAFFESITSSIVLSDSATLTQVIIESASNTLSLTQTIDSDKHIMAEVSVLSLTQTVSVNIAIHQIIIEFLDLTQTAVAKGTKKVSITSILTLTQACIAEGTINKSASNTLNLTQGVTAGQPIIVSAVSTLIGEPDLDDLLLVDLETTTGIPSLFLDIGLRHSVSIVKESNVAVTSFLSLIARTVKVGIASNQLALTQSTRTVEYELVTHHILFKQVATGEVTEPVSNILALTQVADVDGIVSLSISNSLSLKSVVSFVILDLCGFNPGIGAGTFTDIPTAPSPIIPILIRRSLTTLTFPFTIPTNTLNLRNPDFDNVEQFEPRRINRRSRGGTLDVFRDETWPKTRRLIYTFSALKEEQVESLLDFLQESLGKEIGILDFETRQWKGIILTPSAAFGQTGPDNCSFSASLEFEGVLA